MSSAQAGPSQLFLFDIGVSFSQLREVQARMMSHRRAAKTVAAYEHCWRRFTSWCAVAGRDFLPVSSETLCLYVASCIEDDLRLATVRLSLSAIRHEHVKVGLPCPTEKGSEVRQLVNSAARALQERPGGRSAMTPEQVRRISGLLLRSGSVMAARDRALIVLGFALGWRGSELAAVDLADVAFGDSGLRVRQWRSKTDQEGRGREVLIPYGRRAVTCPVRVLRAWLTVRGRWPGPLFTSLASNGEIVERPISCYVVRECVKRCLRLIGESDSDFAAHSLRAGMATAAAEAGANESSIMQRGGWKQISTVMRYVRPARAFRADPLAGVL